jgi:hypothetical protein
VHLVGWIQLQLTSWQRTGQKKWKFKYSSLYIPLFYKDKHTVVLQRHNAVTFASLCSFLSLSFRQMYSPEDKDSQCMPPQHPHTLLRDFSQVKHRWHPGSPKGRGGGGNPTGDHQNRNKKHRFCRHANIKRYTWHTLRPKSATEIGWWMVH